MRRTPARLRPVHLLLATATAGALLLAPQAASAAPAAPSAAQSADFSQFEPQFSGKGYYVSGTGSDTADGLTKQTAFRTLQRAADLTQPGDTVWIMNGTYTKSPAEYTVDPDGGLNSDVLRISRSGTAENYIRYKAVSGHRPLVKLDGNYAGVQVTAAYIVVEGLRIQGYNSTIDAADAMRRALLPADQANEGIFNSPYQGNGLFAFPRFGAAVHHLIFRGNEVFDCPGTGIAANAADYVRVEYNRSHHNNYYSPYANSGISFYQAKDIDDYTGTKFFIRGNVSYSNENKVPFWFSSPDPAQRVISDGNGFIVDDMRKTQSPGQPAYRGGFLYENNLAFDNGGKGFNIFESDNITITKNATYKNARTDSPWIGSEFQISASGNVQVIKNVMVARPDRKIFGTYGSENVTFQDNLFLGGNGQNDFPPGVGPAAGISAADWKTYSGQLQSLLRNGTGFRG